jgi:hypothetical protein
VTAVGALLITWRIIRHAATLPQASCGTATTHFINGETQFFRADPGALTCFSAAVRACRAASIRVDAMGVDTGTRYVFTIEPGGAACQVTELSQDYWASFGGGRSRVSARPCRRTAVTGRGVSLSCDGQDVLIPANVSIR